MKKKLLLLFIFALVANLYAKGEEDELDLPPVFVADVNRSHPLWAPQKILETMTFTIVNEVNGDDKGEGGFRVQDFEWRPVNLVSKEDGYTHVVRVRFNFDDVMTAEALQYGKDEKPGPVDDGVVEYYNRDLVREVVYQMDYDGPNSGNEDIGSGNFRIGKTDVPLYHPKSARSIFLRRSPRHHFELSETNVIAGGVGVGGVNFTAGTWANDLNMTTDNWVVLMTADSLPNANDRTSGASFSLAHIEDDYESKRDGRRTFAEDRVLMSAGVYLAVLAALNVNLEYARQVEEGNADNVAESFASASLDQAVDLPLAGRIRLGVRADKFIAVDDGKDRARAAVALKKNLADTRWDFVVEYGENYNTGSLFDNTNKQHYVDVGLKLKF